MKTSGESDAPLDESERGSKRDEDSAPVENRGHEKNSAPAMSQEHKERIERLAEQLALANKYRKVERPHEGLDYEEAEWAAMTDN